MATNIPYDPNTRTTIHIHPNGQVTSGLPPDRPLPAVPGNGQRRAVTRKEREAYRTKRSPRALTMAALVVFLATLFFWLAAFSVPFTKGLYYIHTHENDVKFGNFGWCVGPPRTGILGTACYQRVGYAWRPWFMGHTHTTGSLILVAFTAVLGTLALLSLMHSIMDLRSGACSFFLTIVTVFFATLSFLIVVILFGVAHHRLNNDHLDAHYGAAFVFVILGWLLYLLAVPLVIVGWFRERHYRRQAKEQWEMQPTAGQGRPGAVVLPFEEQKRKKGRWGKGKGAARDPARGGVV
ncbi:hypothetical protein IAT38_007704 [Cryptococcus sp. DSM 104549]